MKVVEMFNRARALPEPQRTAALKLAREVRDELLDWSTLAGKILADAERAIAYYESQEGDSDGGEI